MDMAFLEGIKATRDSSEQARKVGTSSKKKPRFTESEMSYMRATEGQYTATELSNQLHRPVGSIRDKAYRLAIALKRERIRK